jgi:pimeloyl-ACP methyl ester carboxylesterase
MPQSVELATHEWPPSGTDGADPRVAVLVHGITGWWKTWWQVGPALAGRGWRVIAVDQRAHGRSPAGDPATLDDLARDLEAAIEAHAAAPIDALIGHSLGAAVSQRLAWRRPDIALRLILEDPPGIIRQDDIEFQARLRRDVEAARVRPDEELRRELAEHPAWLEGDARQNVEGRAMTRVDVIVASIRRGRGIELADLAAEIRIPTRYVLAPVDRSVMPDEPRRRLIANLPEGSDALVLDGGHTLHRDRFDEYVTAVFDFLD